MYETPSFQQLLKLSLILSVSSSFQILAPLSLSSFPPLCLSRTVSSPVSHIPKSSLLRLPAGAAGITRTHMLLLIRLPGTSAHLWGDEGNDGRGDDVNAWKGEGWMVGTSYCLFLLEETCCSRWKTITLFPGGPLRDPRILCAACTSTYPRADVDSGLKSLSGRGRSESEREKVKRG